MSDEAWRAHERRWRQDPADLDALGRAVAGLRRSGLVVPPDLLDARVEPATRLETALPLEVWAVLPGERGPTTVGWGPGRVEVPSHRYWGVGDVPAGLEGLGVLGDELRRRAIPGLRLTELGRSRRRPTESLRLDHDALAALGRQPQLRWVELPRWGGSQPVTPGRLVQALGCTLVEVLHAGHLVGDEGEDPGARLEGLEDARLLRAVTLSDRGLELPHLRTLEGLPELDELILDDDELGAKHLERAAFAPRIRRLRLGRFNDRDAVSIQAGFPSLTGLTFDCYGLSVKAAVALAAVPRLSELEVQIRFGGTPTDLDGVLEQLRSTRLTRLSVQGSSRASLGDRGVAAALAITGLRALSLGSHTHADGAVLPSLRGLESFHGVCSDVCWRGLGGATSLRELSQIGSAPDLWGALQALPELRRLWLGHTGAASAPVTTLPTLHSLTLAGSALPARIVAPLRTLHLKQARSAELFDVAQGSVDQLEHLELHTDLRQRDLVQLERLESLRTLELAPFAPDHDVVEQVVRLVRAVPTLRRLAVGRKDHERPMFHIVEIPELERRLAEEAPWVAQVSSID